MTTEIKEIEIFTQEQLEILPQDAKDCIINLGNNLPQKELLILNPLVSELLKIKELAKIKYVPLYEEATKEEIALHKENVEQFKSAKKAISALTQQNSKAKSAIKGPLDLLGKQVLIIEKSVNTIAKEVLTELESTFKVYLDAEAKKTADALARKQEKETAAVNALTEENTIKSNIIKKGALITYLKYEMLEPTKNDVQIAIQNFALDKIFELRDGLKLRTFESYTKEQDFSLLDQEEIESIKISFSNQMNEIQNNLNNRIVALEALKANEKLTDTVETITSIPVTASMDIWNPGHTPTMGIPAASALGMQGISVNESMELGELKIQNDGTRQNTNVFKDKTTLTERVTYLIDECAIAIRHQVNTFESEKNDTATEKEIEESRRVRGGIKLLEKTILYIINQLPPKQV